MNVTLVWIAALPVVGGLFVTLPLLILDARRRRRHWEGVLARRRADAAAHKAFLEHNRLDR